jgi:hypothetical protein
MLANGEMIMGNQSILEMAKERVSFGETGDYDNHSLDFAQEVVRLSEGLTFLGSDLVILRDLLVYGNAGKENLAATARIIRDVRVKAQKIEREQNVEVKSISALRGGES